MRSVPATAVASVRRAVLVERMLPVPGEVAVGRGRRVAAGERIAHTSAPGRPFALYVPDLAANDKEPAVRLTKAVGDPVAAQEPVAARRGFMGREKPVVQSPEAGSVAGVYPQKGHIVIAPPGDALEVHAGVEGIVAEVRAGYGAVLSVSALYGEGLTMHGPPTGGVLRAGRGPADLPAEADLSGSIVVVGRLVDEGIELLAKRGARGVVTGGTPLALWRAIVDGRWPGLTVIVTEGLGAATMPERIFAEFVSVRGAPVLLTRRGGRWGAAGRPQIIVSVARGEYPDTSPPRLEPGAAVRVVAGEVVGRLGAVSAVPAVPRRTQNGRVDAELEVVLEDGRRTSVPAADLELLG